MDEPVPFTVTRDEVDVTITPTRVLSNHPDTDAIVWEFEGKVDHSTPTIPDVEWFSRHHASVAKRTPRKAPRRGVLIERAHRAIRSLQEEGQGQSLIAPHDVSTEDSTISTELFPAFRATIANAETLFSGKTIVPPLTFENFGTYQPFFDWPSTRAWLSAFVGGGPSP